MAHLRSNKFRNRARKLSTKAAKAQNNCCFWCGCKMVRHDGTAGNPHPKNMKTADHVIPISKGGSNEPENIVAACWGCNKDKADTVPTFTDILAAVTRIALNPQHV